MLVYGVRGHATHQHCGVHLHSGVRNPDVIVIFSNIFVTMSEMNEKLIILDAFDTTTYIPMVSLAKYVIVPFLLHGKDGRHSA